MIHASHDEHGEVQIWRNSRGEWYTNVLAAKFEVAIQPYRRNTSEQKPKLLHACGVKRVSYGWWYDVAVESDEFGHFVPALARPFSKSSRAKVRSAKKGGAR